MKKYISFFLALLFSNNLFAQLIQNGSFELIIGSTVAGPNSGSDDVLNWNIVVNNGTADYFSPSCTNVNYRVPNNIAGVLSANDGFTYIGIATIQDDNIGVGEYIATTVNLTAGATYEFKINVSLASYCKYKNKLGLNIVKNFTSQSGPFNFFSGSSNFSHEWGDDNDGMISTPNSQWQELSTTFVANQSGSFTLILGYFRNSTTPNYLLNDNPSSQVSGSALEKHAYYLLDNCSLTETIPPPILYDPCCPYTACFTNTSNLPAETIVSNYIKAGNAEGCDVVTSGPVVITSGQNVIFNAGNYIEIGNQEISPGVYSNIAGMDIQQGATFEAKIDGCNMSNYNSLPPIEIIQLPTQFIKTPSPLGYTINVRNATNYYLQVMNRYGDWVYQQSGILYGNYNKIWEGQCSQNDCSDGQYLIYLTLSNCVESISIDPYWVMVNSPAARNMSTVFDSINTLPTISTSNFLFVSPNPISNEMTINFSVVAQEALTFYCFDNVGNIIMQRTISEVNNKEINQQHFSKLI